MKNNTTGKKGEDIACDYLKDRGYKILSRNYTKNWQFKGKMGEIDIIAQPKRRLFDILKGSKTPICFIEVKTQKFSGFLNQRYFFPEQRVDYKKKQKLKNLAQIWLDKNNVPFNSKWQIDIIAVYLNPKEQNHKIKHFKNAIEDTG